MSPAPASHTPPPSSPPSDTDSDISALLSASPPPSYTAARIKELSSLTPSAISTPADLRTSSSHHPPTTTTIPTSPALHTLVSEPPVLPLIPVAPTLLLHFFSPPFAACAILDKHLSLLASLHPSTRFFRIDVLNAPFLVERLGVRVLPCLVGFVEGEMVGRWVGFDGLDVIKRGREGAGFSTKSLEERLVGAGILDGRVVEEGMGIGEDGSGDEREDEGERDEWD